MKKNEIQERIIKVNPKINGRVWFCSAGLQPGNCLKSKTSEADTPKVKIMCILFWGKDELEENKKTHEEW